VKRAAFNAFPVSDLPVTLVGTNPNRVALIVSASTQGNIWISDQPTLNDGLGILIPTNSKALELCYCDWGDWMQRHLYVMSPDADINVCVVEVIRVGDEDL